MLGAPQAGHKLVQNKTFDIFLALEMGFLLTHHASKKRRQNRIRTYIVCAYFTVLPVKLSVSGSEVSLMGKRNEAIIGIRTRPFFTKCFRYTMIALILIKQKGVNVLFRNCNIVIQFLRCTNINRITIHICE